uniref:Fibronectin type-III domain-containing protein n=1 Tax=Suricata suricatta TaxID=37032 RepID=A0A673SNY1_SURSU
RRKGDMLCIWLPWLVMRFSNVNVCFLQLPILLFESLTVPKPTNIQIKAYNFNTVLSWDYPTMSETPLFIVQVMNYEDAEWIDACNTSQHYCNIFSTISDPSISLWARIKARLGQKESDDAMSEEFILCRHGE